MKSDVLDILVKAIKRESLDKEDIDEIYSYIMANDQKVQYVDGLNNVKELCDLFLKSKAYSSKWDYTILLNINNRISEIKIYKTDVPTTFYLIKTKNTVVHLELPNSTAVGENCYLIDSESVAMLTGIMKEVEEFNHSV